MKRFKFRLQKVLDYREQIRDEKRQELVLRNAELSHEESVLRGLEAEFERTQLAVDGIVRASEISIQGAYSLRLKHLIEAAVERVATARARATEAQERYLEANREARAMEMLREKRLAEYDQEVAREETSLLDEVATQRVSRKITEEKSHGGQEVKSRRGESTIR
jgi:flagellar protein FliJ